MLKSIKLRWYICVGILSGPPSWATASTKRSWSSTVQRKRGLGSVVRTRPESPWTHIALFSYEPFILEGFLAWNILSLWLSFSLSLTEGFKETNVMQKCERIRCGFEEIRWRLFALSPSLSLVFFLFFLWIIFLLIFFWKRKWL